MSEPTTWTDFDRAAFLRDLDDISSQVERARETLAAVQQTRDFMFLYGHAYGMPVTEMARHSGIRRESVHHAMQRSRERVAEASSERVVGRWAAQ